MTNAKEFGARGDGTTDDASALQRALDGGDGDVCLPPGDYRLGRPLGVRLERGRTSLRGSGGCARLVMAAPGPALRLLGTHRGSADPRQTAGAVMERQRMPRVSDLEIVGGHPEADGVEIAFTMQATLTQLVIQRCRHAIRLIERNRNVIIGECHLYNNRGVGVLLDQVNLHQINIVGCHISYNRGGGVKVWHSEVRNLQLAGNDIEYNFDAGAEASADVWIETGAGSVREGAITGNTIQALPSPGGANLRIVGQSAEVGHKAGLLTVSGNLISSQETNVLLQWARGVVFCGNTFFSGHRRTIHAVQCANLVFSGCVFDHNPDYAPETRDGVLLEECEGCVLSGLHFADILAGSDGEGGCVETVRCRQVSVTGCVFRNPRHRALVLRQCEGARVAGCVVWGGGGPAGDGRAVQIVGGQDVVVSP
ncbi:MAG: right-handed parallel beta-helix repeat-containing protein [Armatimonadota bacterium]|nr:right-handed parallel beta-helix repeat-containing protein [Armatimonadota bacterium]